MVTLLNEESLVEISSNFRKEIRSLERKHVSSHNFLVFAVALGEF